MLGISSNSFLVTFIVSFSFFATRPNVFASITPSINPANKFVLKKFLTSKTFIQDYNHDLIETHGKVKMRGIKIDGGVLLRNPLILNQELDTWMNVSGERGMRERNAQKKVNGCTCQHRKMIVVGENL